MAEKNALRVPEPDLHSGYLLVFSSSASEEEALRLGRALVEERLCACVNVLPRMHSIYRWQDKIEEAGEYLLLIKTNSERLPLLQDRIAELHSYDTPEVIAVPITKGSQKYLAWLNTQL